MRIWRMRTGISIDVSAADRRRLEALVRDRNTPQKHKAKTCVWRWQERFAEGGVAGLLRDKTRPSRIPPLAAEIAERWSP